MRSRLENLSRRLDHSSRSFFFRIGYWIAERPIKTIVLSLLFVSVTCLGALKFNAVDGSDSWIWVPQGTLTIEHQEIKNELFPGGVRTNQVLLVSEHGDAVTKAALIEMCNLLEAIEKTVSDEGLRMKDVCEVSSYQHVHFCLTASILDLFFDMEYLAAANGDDSSISYTNHTTSSSDLQYYSFAKTVRNKLLTLDDESIKERVFNGPYSTWNDVALTPDPFVSNLDSNQSVLKSPSIKLIVSTSTLNDVNSQEWEIALEETVIQFSRNSQYQTYAGTLGAIHMAGVNQEQDVPLLMLGILVAIIYVCVTLGHINLTRNRVGLSFAAIVSILLSAVSMVGIGSLVSFYGPVHQLLPLLLVAIGLDDAYVIVAAFDDLSLEKEEWNRESERVARALSRAGSAITITSCTNAFAFLMGSITQIPAMKFFCIWASIGIFMDFVFMTTFFVACLSLDARRRQAHRCDIICCFKANNPSSKNLFGLEDGVLQRFYSSKFAPFLNNKYVSLLIVLISFSTFSACVYGTINLEYNFPLDSFYAKGSNIKMFYDINEIFFGDGDNNVWPIQFFTGEFDYTSIDNQQKMVDLFKQDGYIQSNGVFLDSTLNSWYMEFRDFVGFTPFNDSNENESTTAEVIEPQYFYSNLTAFLDSAKGSTFKDDLIWKEYDDMALLIGSRSYGAFEVSSALSARVAAMKSLRESVSNANLPGAFPFSDAFDWFERDAIMKDEALQILLLALVAVLVITFVMIGNVKASLITLLGPCMSVIDMMGFMYFFDIHLNFASVICLTLSVGMTIDFSSHITVGFMTGFGDRAERVKGALSHLGPPLTHAGLSTFITTGILVFAKTYVFRMFFVMFFMIIAFGMFHGLMVVPIILNQIGPVGYFSNKDEMNYAEDKLAERIVGEGKVERILAINGHGGDDAIGGAVQGGGISTIMDIKLPPISDECE